MANKRQKRQAKKEAKAKKSAAKVERREQRRTARAVLAPTQIADQLRTLAAQVESGTVVLGDKELQLPEQAELEISYQLKKKGGHEIEIKWGGRKQAALLPIE